MWPSVSEPGAVISDCRHVLLTTEGPWKDRLQPDSGHWTECREEIKMQNIMKSGRLLLTHKSWHEAVAIIIRWSMYDHCAAFSDTLIPKNQMHMHHGRTLVTLVCCEGLQLAYISFWTLDTIQIFLKLLLLTMIVFFAHPICVWMILCSEGKASGPCLLVHWCWFSTLISTAGSEVEQHPRPTFMQNKEAPQSRLEQAVWKGLMGTQLCGLTTWLVVQLNHSNLNISSNGLKASMSLWLCSQTTESRKQQESQINSAFHTTRNQCPTNFR